MWHRTINDIKALKWVTLQLRNRAGIPQIWSNLGKPFMNFSIIYGLIREATLRLWLFEKSLSLAHHVLLPSITQMTSTAFFLTKKERKERKLKKHSQIKFGPWSLSPCEVLLHTQCSCYIWIPSWKSWSDHTDVYDFTAAVSSLCCYNIDPMAVFSGRACTLLRQGS